jgi:outer membrane translocation and assembly module TamA
MLVPVYQDYNFSKFELNLEEAFPVGNDQTLTAKLRAGAILGPTVPDFFNFYLGGLIGMKSYPFYAISGNRIGWLNLTYRFPIWRGIDTRIGQLYIDKIFFSVFGDLGNAWNGKFPKLNKFKKGAGAEIRIKINSFYVFPTSLFFSAAYSFDKFTNTVLNEQITYGKKWKFYGGILFDFSL